MPAVFCVSEKLRRSLSTLVGDSAFRLLLARALTLATAQDARLCAVQVKPDGSLEGLGGQDQDPGVGVMLITQLLELLVTFIGEGLVMNLLLDSWPNLASINPSEKKDHDPTR